MYISLTKRYQREEYDKLLQPYKDRYAQQIELLKNRPVHVDDYDYQHNMETEMAEGIIYNNLTQE